MGLAGKRIIGIVLAWLAVLCPAAASAQPGTLAGTPLPVCLTAAHTGDGWRAFMAEPARFACTARQTAFGPGDYWVMSTALPPRAGQALPADVRVASLWQDRIALYALYADGTVVRQALDGRGISRHLQPGAILRWQFAARTVPIVRLLWHVEGAANLRGVVNGAAIATPDESAHANTLMAAVYAAFGGMGIALLVYNLALWVALRHRFQVAYCAMIVALLAYAVSSSGALAWLLPGITNNERLQVNYLTLAIAAVSALAFARSFFEPRIFAGWLNHASRAVSAALLASAVVFMLVAPHAIGVLDRVYAAAFMLLLAIVAPVMWRAWRLGSRYLWLFALAWGAPIALATVRVAGNFDLLGWNFWLDNSTVLSMAAEALLSSLAIAYRINLLSRERDEAREQEIAARLLADTDPLTALLNRRAFLRHAIGRDGDQVLILADIDHFKAVNETLGHDGGDEVLRVVARALRMAVPGDALVARIGGEEFAIVAPATSTLSPLTLLEAVRGQRMPFDLAVTVSLGSCTGSLETEVAWKALYRRADRALFDAKAAGRDRARDASRLAVAA